MVAELLRDEGYVVATASDGLESLTYLRGSTIRPGLILLDLMMPNMDGVQFRHEQLKAFIQDLRVVAQVLRDFEAGGRGTLHP